MMTLDWKLASDGTYEGRGGVFYFEIGKLHDGKWACDMRKPRAERVGVFELVEEAQWACDERATPGKRLAEAANEAKTIASALAALKPGDKVGDGCVVIKDKMLLTLMSLARDQIEVDPETDALIMANLGDLYED